MDKKNILINIGIFVITFAVMLFLAEIAWRIIEKPDSPRQFHSQLAMTNVPNSSWTIKKPEYKIKIKINSHGFRGEEFPEPNKNAVRIVFIGDSFLEGKQVKINERFAEIASRELEKMLNVPVQSYVLGMGGAHPAHELLYYRNLGRKFNPHIVVQVLFPQNDLPSFSEKLPFLNTEITNLEEIILNPTPASHCNWKCYLLRNSRIILHTYHTFRKINPSNETTDRVFQNPYTWYFSKGINKIEKEERLKALSIFTDTTKREVEKDNAKYITIVVPGAFEIYEEWRNIYLHQNKLENEELDDEYLQNSVVQTLENNGTNVINLKPELKAISNEIQLYYWSDPHFSKDGNKFVGTLLSKKLYPFALDTLENK